MAEISLGAPVTVSIEVHLFASLKKYLPDEVACAYPVEPGTPVSVVFDRLKIPENEVKLIFINGVKTDGATLLSGGERLGVFPPIGGG